MTGLGALVVRKQEEWETRLIVGYGILTLAFVIFGTTTEMSLRWMHAAVLIAGGAGLLSVSTQGSFWRDAGRSLLLVLPLFVVLAAAVASQWDEFTNWLPKHRYLWDYDAFPRLGLPPSLSVLPSYPYGLPIVGYLAARTAGLFVENAGALFNTILLVATGQCLARLIAGSALAGPARTVSWGELALGLLLATLLCPTFVPKIAFTSYLDTTTAVMLMFAGLYGWQALEAHESGDHAQGRQRAWHGALAMVVLVNLKQVNLVLAGLVAIGLCLAGTRTTTLRWGQVITLLMRLMLPAIAVWILWRMHVARHIPGGEFAFRPLEEWLWSGALDIAARIVLIASKKGGYFGMMAVLLAAAVYGLLRPSTPFSRLAMIVAVTFTGYNVFLYVAYLGAFGAGEALIAASYWRYNMQLGLLGTAALVYGGVLLYRARHREWRLGWVASRALAGFAVAAILLAPVVLAGRIRFDLNPAKTFVRAVGAELHAILPPGTVLAVIDPRDNGFWSLLIRYELDRAPSDLHLLYGTDYLNSKLLRQALERAPLARHAWVHVPEPAIEEALGISLKSRESHLLKRDGETWALVRSWAWPAYVDPHAYNN